MGSLFRVREWSAIKIDDEHGFDCNSLLACNIDNSADAEGESDGISSHFITCNIFYPVRVTDKMIVGSLSGILRLYKSNNSSKSNQQPLIEVDFGLPILALAAGRLLPSSDSLHLLILHPFKVCVYSVSGDHC
jgi:Bardet-Biedl syndrome 9 protein